MSLLELTKLRQSEPRRTSVNKRGWIGVDIGTYAVKLAQMQHVGSHSQIVTRWSLVDTDQKLRNDEDPLLRLKGLRSLRRLFTGKKCAAALPMSSVQHRSLEVPRGTHDEQYRMVGEELAADLGVELPELAYDYWENFSAFPGDSEMVRVTVNAVPKNVATRLGETLLSAGVACQILDSTCCAIARAVDLADTGKDDQASVAVDLGYTSPVVVLVKRGQPLYARTLREAGVRTLIEPLERELDLSFLECQQLLCRYGIPAGGCSPSFASQRTMQAIAQPLQMVFDEIKRTVDYFDQQFRSCKPQKVVLMGGGALIKNLPERLSEILRLPVSNWSLAKDKADPTDALYAVAAGLSALAWEDGVCS